MKHFYIILVSWSKQCWLLVQRNLERLPAFLSKARTVKHFKIILSINTKWTVFELPGPASIQSLSVFCFADFMVMHEESTEQSCKGNILDPFCQRPWLRGSGSEFDTANRNKRGGDCLHGCAATAALSVSRSATARIIHWRQRSTPSTEWGAMNMFRQ